MASEEVRWLAEAEQVSWRAYLRANRELDVALDRDLQAVGISLSEYELLSMLSEAPMGQLRMSALATPHRAVAQPGHPHRRPPRAARLGQAQPRRPTTAAACCCASPTTGARRSPASPSVHVASVRRHLVDILTPEQFAALGEAMQAIRDAYAADPTTPDEAAD